MHFRTQHASNFIDDTRGSVTLLFALASLVLFVSIGLAIDSARYNNLASKMQDSLDAATLAGAKLMDDDSISDEQVIAATHDYYKATMVHAGIPTISKQKLTVNVDRPTSTVRARADAVVPSYFGRLAKSSPTVPISRLSNVVYEMDRVELAMVLDITGSMNTNNKLADMKVAAKDVVDLLFADAINDRAVRVALAPYSASVNAGGLAAMVGMNSPPDSVAPNSDTCVIERTGFNAATDAAAVGPDRLPNVTTMPYGYYSCPSAPVVPLLGKDSASTLHAAIDGYTGDGATAGHIGTAWGWYLLSQDWKDVFPTESKPSDYNDPKVNKSILIMTDGVFNTSYKSGPTTDPTVQITESYEQFESLCTNMKAKGITVYTVGFALDDPRATEELKACASSDDKFFDAKTGTQLKSAFKKIASQLNRLRVAN